MNGTSKFLLLLGPSGVGKSRIIWRLQELDRRYTYISPFTNRVLRDGETDKVHIDDAEMDRMAAANELLVVNEVFGYRYATPKRPILDAFESNQFPLLDWPVGRIGVMQDAFPSRLYAVYIRPPSLEVLAIQLNTDGRDPNGTRFQEATVELDEQALGAFEADCDITVVNNDGEVDKTALRVHRSYLQSLG